MKKLILGVPSGSLNFKVMEMLKRAGITISFTGRKFEAKIDNNSLFGRVILMGSRKIPGAVARGTIDVGITGLDRVEESPFRKKVKIIQRLNFSKNSNQAPRIVVFGFRKTIVDKKSILVSAEFKRLARKVFKRAKIEFSDGTTEADVISGDFDYGVCVCDTGESLRANGLNILKVIMEAPVVVIAKKVTPKLKLFGEILNGTLEADKRSLIKFNCAEDLKDHILAFLPAIDAPTVNRLSNGNYAIETVAGKEQVFDLQMKLKTAGATGILVQDFNALS